MKFFYGLVLGILATLVGTILYLGLGGGELLLKLSPTFHEMKTRLEVLGRAEEQRLELARKLELLEQKFSGLAERFEALRRSAESRGTSQEAPPEGPNP
jgi:hypothetical protein